MLRYLSIVLVAVATIVSTVYPAFSWNQTASSTVVAHLPAIMSVDAPINPRLQVERVTRLGQGVNQLRLSSINYKIKTNTGHSVHANGNFISLSNGQYSFSRDKLRLETRYNKDLTITPIVKVTPDVPPGNYNGTIILTISNL